MYFNKIADHEKSFFDTGKGISGSEFILEKKSIPGLDYMKCTPKHGATDHYYAEKHNKTSAVLHLTEGVLKSDVYYLTHKGHTSVPFLIARDGTILNLHSSRYWSYHLGKTSSGGNTRMSQRTIAIELSNIGKLKLEGDYLIDRYGGKYCHTVDTNEYHKVATYRGYEYYADCTHLQYQSLVILLKYLRDHRNIHMKFLPKDIRYETQSSEFVQAYNGVLSHVNFRDNLDDEGDYYKVDIGPGFNWDYVIQGVNGY